MTPGLCISTSSITAVVKLRVASIGPTQPGALIRAARRSTPESTAVAAASTVMGRVRNPGIARRTLENVKAILVAGGASVGDVLMFRVYLTKRADFAAMNEVYGEFIAENVTSGALPCRTTVFVELPHEVMLVEIDALAVTGS